MSTLNDDFKPMSRNQLKKVRRSRRVNPFEEQIKPEPESDEPNIIKRWWIWLFGRGKENFILGMVCVAIIIWTILILTGVLNPV